ncbi:GntR family transcriptional regulator [Streptomyces sp. NPDC014734]|uniref:GntR family transcriptional regulator n=1 Tax=Streptomyces sp. NPDC014734 TaxID=3364886 RepID=UPI0036F8B823
MRPHENEQANHGGHDRHRHHTSSGSRAQRARRLADMLRQQIVDGAFGDGRLPDERALARSLDSSRNAVREALDLLRGEGLITRRRGVGTQVVTVKYGHRLDRLTGLAQTLTDHGDLRNEVRVACLVPAPPASALERLRLDHGSPAVHLERLRRLNGEPLSVDTTWLAPDIGTALLDKDLAGRDVFDLIEETTGTPLGYAEITVHAITADHDTAALLGIPVGAPLFAIDRLTHLSDGRPVDAESLRIRADRLTLSTVLERGPRWTG